MTFYKLKTLSQPRLTKLSEVVSRLLILLALLTLCSCQQASFTSSNASLLELHNEARKSGIRCALVSERQANILSWNTQLANAALTHSEEMHALQKLTHLSRDGLSVKSRIDASGYQWQSYAENLASGVYDDQAVFNLWLDSKQHCQNIMNANYTQMGAAQVNGYWTAIYAQPK